MPNNMEKHNTPIESFLISREQKEEMNGHKAFVVWLTGLSGAGKSTIARWLEVALFQQGIRTLVLDGDNTRKNINIDLGFTQTDRSENIRRVAEIAKLLNDAGVVVISAFISPFADDREKARQIIGEDRFIEVFIDTTLATCIARDTKGLYKKAIEGELNNFTGISSPYESPQQPSITIHTENQTPKNSVQEIIDWLIQKHYISPTR